MKVFSREAAGIVCGGLLCVMALSGCGGGGRPDSVLLITLDTLRADHVSCYGGSPVSTPHLDALAAEGVRFDGVWSTVPLTTPAHASILSGQYPMSHGIRNNARFRLPDSVRTMAELLSGADRSSAAFVAAFTTSRIFGLAQGFDEFHDDMGRDDDGRQRSQKRGDQVVAAASEWLRTAADGPFFLWVHLYDPHTPYEPPPQYGDLYPGRPYRGEVAFTDALVGRLVEVLDETGAGARTVVAVVGDHGEGLGDHGEPEHGFLLYEPMIEVPMILRAPGRIRAGMVHEGPASIIDLMPTVLALLGRRVPSGIQGVDLLGNLEADRSIYAETLYPHEEKKWSALYALRKGDLKYIESPKPELYDLSEDPEERNNLYDEQPETVSDMVRALQYLAEESADHARLAEAAGLGGDNVDEEAIERLESLGYVGGGLADPSQISALPAVQGRNPADSMEDLVLFKQADVLLSSGAYEEARRMFYALQQRDPGNPQVALKLARSTEKLELHLEAERLYAELVEQHPSYYLGYKYFSRFLEDRERPLESRDLWLRLADRFPGYVVSAARIAGAENKAGLHKEAELRMRAHLETKEDDAGAWVELGTALSHQGDEQAALDAYRRALTLQPTNKDALDPVLNLLLTADRDDEALELLQELLRQAPGDPLLRRYLDSLASS